MDSQNLLEKIEEIIQPILELDRIELVEVIFRPQGPGHILRLFVDKPGGVTLKECSALNREISGALDKSGIIEASYTLEVSSPGLDRPLVNEKDFVRVKGKRVRIVTAEQICGICEHGGEVAEVSEGIVTILKENAVIEIPIDKIKIAKQEIEF